jgi:hypothetical protein
LSFFNSRARFRDSHPRLTPVRSVCHHAQRVFIVFPRDRISRTRRAFDVFAFATEHFAFFFAAAQLPLVADRWRRPPRQRAAVRGEHPSFFGGACDPSFQGRFYNLRAFSQQQARKRFFFAPLFADALFAAPTVRRQPRTFLLLLVAYVEIP